MNDAGKSLGYAKKGLVLAKHIMDTLGVVRNYQGIANAYYALGSNAKKQTDLYSSYAYRPLEAVQFGDSILKIVTEMKQYIRSPIMKQETNMNALLSSA